MFFDLILLNYQHNGNLGKAWIAATRGIKYVSSEDVVSINICRLSDDLYKFITSSSGDPKKRFSLRMSAILLHGTIRLHNRQVAILQVDAAKVLQRCTIPAGSRISFYEKDEDSESEHSPRIRVKSKRQKKKQVISELTPIEEFAPGMQRFDEIAFAFPQADDVLRHPGHPEVITMRETEIAPKSAIPEEGFGADVSVEDILTILERVGSPLKPSHQLLEKSVSSSPTVTQPVQIVVQAEVHASRGSYIDEAGSPAVRAELTGKEPTVPYPTVQEPSAVTPMEIEHVSVQPPIPMEVIEIAPSAEVVPPTAEQQTIPPVDIPVAPAEAADSVEPQVKPAQHKVDTVRRPTAVSKTLKITEEDRKMLDRLIVKTKPTIAVITRCLREKNKFTGPPVWYRLPPPDEPNTNRLYQLLWDDTMEGEGGFEQVRAQEASREDQMRVSAQLPEIGSARSTMDKRSSDENLLTPKETTLEERRRSRRKDRVTPIRSLRGEEGLPVEQIPRHTGEVEPMPSEQVLVEEAMEQMHMEVPLEHVPTEQAEMRPVPMEQEPIEEVQVQQVEPVVQVTAGPAERTPELVESEEMEVICERKKTRLETSPRSMSDYKKRQQNIVDIVSRWDFSSSLLTIEDICEKPFNKLNMAKAFSDLLTLTANKFIRLKTQEGSLELSHILKGPRLEQER